MGDSSRQGRWRWDTRYQRYAILTREGPSPGKVAWVTKGQEGMFIGVARAASLGTRYSYLPDGRFYRTVRSQTPAGARESEELVSRYPPMAEVKGLVQVLSVDAGPGDRLRNLPFKRKFKSVYVKPLNGRVSFKLGLLEPGVPQALDTIKRREEHHFRLITETEPWILLWNSAGFESQTG